MLRYHELKENWQHCLTMTGVVPGEFEQYLPSFTAAYATCYPQWQASGDSEEPLAQMTDKLLFIWLYHKVQTLPPDLGRQFDLNLAETHAWIAHLSPVWQSTLDTLTHGKLSPNCIHFLQLLNRHQVEYLIVGGYAVAFHGYQRPLLDLDIFIATNAANAQKLVQVLHTFGHGVDPQTLACFQMAERVIRLGHPPFTIQPFAPNERMIQMGTPPKQLEILTAISAVTFTECYPARVTGIIHDVPVPIIGLSQLKRNKQASIRHKDADDLAHLPC